MKQRNVFRTLMTFQINSELLFDISKPFITRLVS